MDSDLILIVDQDQEFCQSLVDFLRAQSCPAQGAGSGQAALELLRTHNYAVVISSLSLPDLDSLEVLLGAQMRAGLSETIVIFLADESEQDKAIEVLRAGAHDVLMRPMLTRPFFGAIVARALERHAIGEENMAYRYSLERQVEEAVGERKEALAQREEAILQKEEAFAQIERDKTIFENALELSRAVNRTLERKELLGTIDHYFKTIPLQWEYALCEFFEADEMFRVLAHNRSDWAGHAEIVVPAASVPLITDALLDMEIKKVEAADDPELTAGDLQGLLKPASVCLPIHVSGTSLALLIHIKHTERISDEDFKMADLSAEFAGMALNNSILFERTRELSRRDGLTGLYNHSHFQSFLEREIRRAERYGKPLSIIMADLNNFKGWNDTLGHQVGDQLLERVARRISSQVREGLDMVARYGGDEFVVVLPETEETGAQAQAKRLQQAVELENTEWPVAVVSTKKVGLSVGVASWTGGMSREQLIALADNALYEYKALVHNRDHTTRVGITHAS